MSDSSTGENTWQEVGHQEVSTISGTNQNNSIILSSSPNFRLFCSFFAQKSRYSILFCYLCTCYLPLVAGKHIAMCRAAGWSTTYRKALLTLCFWMFELPQSKSSLKQCWVTPRGVVYTLRSVLRGYVYPHKHTLRCIYMPQRGCFSVCLLLWLW